MFQDEYKAIFSKVTASEETYRRIMNMTNKKKKHRSASFISKALIAAVIVSLLAVTATAAESARGYFYSFFAKDSQVELSDGQIQYIEDKTLEYTQAPFETLDGDNTQEHTEKPSAIADGYTVTVDSALADERDAYIRLTLTAPEGKNLDADDYRFYVGSGLERDGINLSLLDASGVTAEAEGCSVSLFCAFRLRSTRHGTFADGLPVTLVLSGLEEVRTEGGEERSSLLSDGPWKLELTFNADTALMEVLSESIPWNFGYNSLDSGEGQVMESVAGTITSIKLASMSAELVYELADGRKDSVVIPEMSVVLESGEQIRLIPRNMDGENGRIGFSSSGPILLDKVTHILLPDGTSISVAK